VSHNERHAFDKALTSARPFAIVARRRRLARDSPRNVSDIMTGRVPIMAVLALAARVAAAGESVLVDGVAAYVNDHVVTIGDVQAIIEPVRRQLIAKYSGVDLAARLRQAFSEGLDTLVDRRLILDAYEKLDRKLPQWVIDERIEAIVRDQFGGDRAKALNQLSKENVSWEEWQKEVGDHIAVSYMRQSYIEENVKVPVSAVREAYDRDKADYSTPAQVKLRLIELDRKKEGNSRELADKVAARVSSGEDFASLAAKYSGDSSSVKGGDWGWVEPRILRAELAAACEGVKVGGKSGVIETEDAFYIVMVEGRREGAVLPFAEVQGRIERGLRQDMGLRQLKAWTARLRDAGYVKILPVANVESGDSEPSPAP
jgi:parvulin-like peptidyl-prolyl isomerase